MTRGVKPKNIVSGTSTLSGVPKTPPHLSNEAKAIWRNTARILILERKTLTEADIPALESFVVPAGMMQRCEREMKGQPLVIDGKRNPLTTIYKDAHSQMLKAAAVLGLTPADRSRVSIMDATDDEDDNPLAIGRHRANG
nr:phage terminase small subunit P27 family [uncultured Cohaesibacter sp.]